jgi:hypothetical protein
MLEIIPLQHIIGVMLGGFVQVGRERQRAQAVGLAVCVDCSQRLFAQTRKILRLTQMDAAHHQHAHHCRTPGSML